MQRKEGEKYNGWTNYETWAVSLWIDNEESSYRYWRGEAGRYQHDIEDQLDAVRVLATQLKQEISDNAPTDAPNVYSDLLTAALSDVNWAEIAENLLSQE
jgi:hypothetical protein